MTDPEPLEPLPEAADLAPGTEPAPDVAPEPFEAQAVPVVPPKWDTPMEDPSHPLHYHFKRDTPVSPEPAKDQA